MKRRIVLFHPTLLPPRDYGGVERVVLWLAKGLQELGQEVAVAALAGSRLPPGVGLIEVSPDRCSAHDLLPLLPPGVDLVHFMAPPEPGAMESLPCAGILTVHGNGKPGERFPRNTVFLSRDHARRHQAEVYVHNGIDPAEYRFEPRSKGERCLFLSKTSWKVKNLRGAVRLCRRAGAGLEIAGGNRPYGVRLQAAIDPRLRWLGPVSGSRKAEALARARLFVFPVLWPEPFGLVVAEALISGTPVVASRLGSVPELVTDDVGAVLPPPVPGSGAEEAWIEALRPGGPRRWDPEACRDWAIRQFHYRKMAESYLQHYEAVIAGAQLHEREPGTAATEGKPR